MSSSTSSSSYLYPSSSLDYTPALSPSSSSNSVAAAAAAADTSGASDASDTSVTTVATSILAVASPDSSLTFSSPPPPISSRDLDLARRFSDRPLPLTLKTTHNAINSNSNGRQFAPCTSSLSTLPSIATITTTTTVAGGIERRSQSLASNNQAVHAVHAVAASSFSPAPSTRNSSASALSVVTVGPIKRKPLASNSIIPVSPLAVQHAPSPTALLAESVVESVAESEYAVNDYLRDEHDESLYPVNDSDHGHSKQEDVRFAFDLDGELDINIDDFLPTPDQRFTRSGSVDSPTLYEFPKTAALFSTTTTTTSALTPSSLSKAPVHAHSPSLSVEEVDQDSSAVFPDSESTDFREFVATVGVGAVAAGASSTRNSLASTPAAPQTDPATVLAHYEQDLTATTETLGSSDQILAEQPFYESENSSDQEQESVEEPTKESTKEPTVKSNESAKSAKESDESQSEPEEELNITQRNSTMSLFTRKTSPPHLSLGSISNNNTTNSINHHTPSDNKEDNAQRSVSPDDRNSLYSIYDDEELQDKNIPIGLPTISTSPVTSNSNINNKNNNSINTPNSDTVHTVITSDDDSPNTLRPNTKSPSSFKLGTFFGWPSASPSSTEFSDQGFSPLPSPSSPSSLQPPPSTTFTHASTLSTPGTNSPPQQQDGFSSFGGHSNKNRNLLGIISPSTKTNTAGDESLSSSSYYEDYLQTPPIISPGARTASPTSPLSVSFQIEEMEDELKAISAELAGSIRREMDLEDLVDRLQTEVNNPQPPSKRTSDYFSDSGAISSKFGDYDAAKEEIAQVQRRAEQEKAQIRLELTEKLTDERSRRRMLDQQIKELSERASGLDLDARNNSDATGRVKQLESTCEDLRRRLSEERGVKENFEDLLAAMKTELQNASNERDNLRDEVVPQLHARVEGLESQATDHARQIYEATKLQQELQSLKDENSNLRSIAALSAENSALATPALIGNSSDNNNSLSTLSRSNTVKGQLNGPPSSTGAGATTSTNESREGLAERLKDVEAQRDALHSALKSLLERQEFQNRENDKKIRVLEMERQRLLTASPKKAGYERDVASLRDEVSVLRRRAEEALEQKWQVEKGLSGLKMDLDRAEDEIASLRGLLQQKDILLHPSSGSSLRGSSTSSLRGSSTSSVYDTDGTGATSLSSRSQPVTSASLEIAYKNLQKSYADALGRIRALESSSGAPGSVIPSDEKTTLALERLERTLTSTMAERDAARDEVATHMSRLADSAGSEKTMLENERSLAEQLDASARRVEELAQQVRTQLETNTRLRDRLAQMVARGEADQQTHKNRITGLESRLRALEEQLVATQTAAEDRVARHEEQIAALKEAHSTQLQRLRDASGGIRAASSPNRTPVTSPRMLSSSQFGGLGSLGGINGAMRSPMSPMFSVNGKLVPPATSSSRPSSRGSAMSGGAASDGALGSSMSASAAAAVAAEQHAQVTTLKARVGELETALASADNEMQEVVGRMNTAQIEVMQLQEELEEAGRETRRLQRMLEAEKVKGFEERFKMLSRSTTA
ncbi:hypothetical protein SCUCBS95973_008559 [Sporothrix curviconia]|uniref:DUF7603 domain-containing protein n=1 Tax=Sporothrix curviconia TaxID=1260050 RepID=A0ABP0CMX6_9PEZI